MQSIVIPSSREEQDHIAYQIVVTTSSGRWHVYRRYREFEAAHRALAKDIGPPPVSLPAKSGIFAAAWSTVTGFGACGSMSGPRDPAAIDERRRGLERYLRGLLVCKDTRFSEHPTFQALVGAKKRGRSGENTAESSPAVWMSQFDDVQHSIRKIRGRIARRDALGSSNSAYAESSGIREDLGKADRAARGLRTALENLVQERLIVREEEQHRQQMLRVLGLEIDALNRQKDAPRRLSAAPSSPAPSAKPRKKSAGRVLGKPQETDETRPLDNRQVLELQNNAMSAQDEQLDVLADIVRRQRELGGVINEEVAAQLRLIEETDDAVGKTQSRINKAQAASGRL